MNQGTDRGGYMCRCWMRFSYYSWLVMANDFMKLSTLQNGTLNWTSLPPSLFPLVIFPHTTPWCKKQAYLVFRYAGRYTKITKPCKSYSILEIILESSWEVLFKLGSMPTVLFEGPHWLTLSEWSSELSSKVYILWELIHIFQTLTLQLNALFPLVWNVIHPANLVQ